MRLFALLLVTFLIVAGAGCRPEVEGQVPCDDSGDLSCPTGWHCDPSTALCVEGENQPLVTFSELEPEMVLFGFLQLEFSAVSAVGFDSVRLVANGASADKIREFYPERIGGDGLNVGTWSAPFETWRLEDGPSIIKVIATDRRGGTSEGSIGVEVRNGTPVVSILTASETTPGTVEATVSVVSKVPILRLEARLDGVPSSSKTVVVDYETSERLRGSATVTLEIEPNEEPTVVVFTATDVAKRTGNAEAHVSD